MAKIRVYELAKDLSMTNRELLEKVIDLNIEASSHMSSLDDESVAKIKSELFGKTGDKVDEKRVHPTVIRRRKKIDKEPKSANLVTVLDAEGNGREDPKLSEDTVKKDSLSDIGEIPGTVKDDTESIFFDIDNDNTAKELSPKSKFKSEDEVSYDSVDGDSVSESETQYEAESLSLKERESILNEDSGDNKSSCEITQKCFKEKSPLSNRGDKELQVGLSSDSVSLGSKNDRIKISKEKPAKIIKRENTPARIIKKAHQQTVPVVKLKPKSGPVAAPIVSSERKTNSIVGDVVSQEEKKGKSFKKRKSFRRKEIVERADLYSGRKRNRKVRKNTKSKSGIQNKKTQITTAKAIKRRIKVDDTIILADLAKRMGIKASEMITKLMAMGVMVTVNQIIDFDTACLVAGEFNYEVEKASFEEESIIREKENDDPSKKVQRPPVVTIMGHVDHGKTSLLDAIRKTRVTEGEIGGITQHIGAYCVETKRGVIVFLDTPGHEAFSAMRSRGARVTDIVVLVVAADDGVMPQTIEAINHSKASDVPIIVAINKMDKLNSSADRVLRELTEHGLVPEGWGGETISVEVSAKSKLGIETLLEMILLQAEILELKANPEKLARGHVVESRLDSGRGPVATVLVQEGTLHFGDSVICGMHYGKVRALQDDVGRKVESAGPSMPVEIIGLSGVPMAGDEVIVLRDEKDARQVSAHRIQKQRSMELAKTNRLSLEGLFERMKKGEIKELNLIIKADVDGSIEALKDSLVKLSNEEVDINIVHSATGTISESDVSLAAVSNAIIIGFNVRPNAKVQEIASDENVDMRFYNIIYNVIKDVKGAIVGMMDSVYKERLLGRAGVRQVFHVPKVGTVAGCHVTDGKIIRGELMRLLRDGVVVYQGKNSSLRRFKEDVKEVQSGYECGIGIENFNDIKVNDTIEAYFMEEIKPEID